MKQPKLLLSIIIDHGSMKIHYNGIISHLILYNVSELIENHRLLVESINWKGKNSKIKVSRGIKITNTIKIDMRSSETIKRWYIVQNKYIILVGIINELDGAIYPRLQKSIMNKPSNDWSNENIERTLIYDFSCYALN